MSKKKEKKIDLNNLEPEEKMKYEVAEELGLLDRVLADGWKSLTSKETGRIGGMVTKKKRENNSDRPAAGFLCVHKSVSRHQLEKVL